MQTQKRTLVPNHIARLKPYVPGKTIAEIKQRYDPPYIAKLGSNENRLGCSPRVTEVLCSKMENLSDYPDPQSLSLCSKLSSILGVKEQNIITGHGSNGIIQFMVQTFLGEEEYALSASGTFIGFLVAAAINNTPIDRIPLTSDFRFDLEAMADAITEKTKMVYIANPNNPTGTYVTRSEFEVFMERVPGDVLVVMDEAYFEYARYLPDYPDALEYPYPNLIVLRTFSKAFGLAGLRVGYAVANREVIRQLYKVKPPFSPSSTAQIAAMKALEDIDFLNYSRKMVEKGKNQLYTLFDEYNLEYAPSAANSVMVKFQNTDRVEEFNRAMLKQGVIIRPLQGFGMPEAIRITIGNERDMQHFEESFRKVM